MIDLKGYGWMLWDGVQVNLAVGPLALLVALALGLLGSWGKLSQNALARRAADGYTVIVRGVPELVLIILVYYGTPTLIQTLLEKVGYEIIIDVNPFVTGVWTLGAIYGALATEVFRGAYLAVPRGEIEAARACGMSGVLLYRRIILPKAFRLALPAYTNEVVYLLQSSSLVSIITLMDLTGVARVIAARTFAVYELLITAAVLYLILTYGLLFLLRTVEIAWTGHLRERRDKEGPEPSAMPQRV